ncbi:Dabb family protein [Canibacter zhoujuaniae]|uniref:Dabb family protein n=1 Tax=Canibacter zhoujuaniae TaxID=2708343 RepID=UPI001420A9F8|nr:Dabb family protein [Canibacter zhoujuaniae]
MLRHVVMWKMNGATVEARAEQAAECAAALKAMDGKIPTLEHIEVHAESLGAEGNWDLVLITDFADAAALAEYSVHPEHLQVVEIVKPRSAARAAVDAEY